jgi:hypothetical protein
MNRREKSINDRYTSSFLERLLERIPFIENLSFGINDEELNNKNNFDIHT